MLSLRNRNLVLCPAEYWLKLILSVCGLADLMAVIGVVMPQSWLAWCVAKAEPWVSARLLVTYLVRLNCGFEVLFGAMLLVFASDVRRYKTPITIAMCWILFFILATGIPGARYVPFFLDQWFFWCLVVEGLGGLVLAALVLFLQSRISHENRGAIPDDRR